MHNPWIHEPAMAAMDDEGRIYEQVISKAPDFLVSIYEGAEVDPELTARSGRQRYRNVPMICIRIRGEKDFVSEVLTDTHLRRFPRAAKWWAEHKGDAPKVSCALLPGITAADLAELSELNITDLATLADASVPENLAPWQDMARRFRSLSKPRLRVVDGQLEKVA